MWPKSPESAQKPPQGAPPPPPSSAQPRATVFGKETKIIGEVSSDEELQVDGELEGKLSLRHRVTIGPSAKVKANIKAREVVVFGSVHGNIEAEERIALRAGASVVGDIKTAGIHIEDGAYFKGGIDISRTSDQTRPEAALKSPSNASRPTQAARESG